MPWCEFIKRSGLTAGGAMVVPTYLKNMISNSPNERLNIAVVGISGERERVGGMISGRGRVHINTYAQIPNVTIKTIYDIDERLFPGVISTVEKLFVTKPGTEVDFCKLLDDKDIDVISIATPAWHAQTVINVCQAGKDVYVEKPVCHNLSEGRKMVQVARKYKRFVPQGYATGAAMQ